MNRRSVLSTFCTGALALLAPVAAWAQGRRKPRPISDDESALCRAVMAAHDAHTWNMEASAAELRALLAEARIYIHGQANSERYQYERHEELDDLLSRIDDALKGHEHA